MLVVWLTFYFINFIPYDLNGWFYYPYFPKEKIGFMVSFFSLRTLFRLLKWLEKKYTDSGSTKERSKLIVFYGLQFKYVENTDKIEELL